MLVREAEERIEKEDANERDLLLCELYAQFGPDEGLAISLLLNYMILKEG